MICSLVDLHCKTINRQTNWESSGCLFRYSFHSSIARVMEYETRQDKQTTERKKWIRTKRCRRKNFRITFITHGVYWFWLSLIAKLRAMAMSAHQWNGTHTFREEEEEEKTERKRKRNENETERFEELLQFTPPFELLNALNGIDFKLNQKSCKPTNQPAQTYTQNINYLSHLIELWPPAAYQLSSDIIFNFFKWETFSQLITKHIDKSQIFNMDHIILSITGSMLASYQFNYNE